MKLENFDKWLAIRLQHRDDAYWPGRLSFDTQNGIHLETANFGHHSSDFDKATFSNQTLTGWLDYQRPTTLISPRIQEFRGNVVSLETPVNRVSLRLNVNALLKNVFLEDINKPIFTGLEVKHPAINAWISPNLVERDWMFPENDDRADVSVNIKPRCDHSIGLKNGTQASVISFARVSMAVTLTARDDKILFLRFPEPVDYKTITRLVWRISSLFEFLIGARTETPLYRLPTIKKQMLNDKYHAIVAELWCRPASKMSINTTPPSLLNRMMVEDRASVSMEVLLNMTIGGSDELI